jgi:ribonuclease HI
MEIFDVIAYTDGACKGNPGIGGCGVKLVCKNGSSEFFGGEQITTNNRMELIATIKAIEKCPEHPSTVLIYTDSQYLMKGITE